MQTLTRCSLATMSALALASSPLVAQAQEQDQILEGEVLSVEEKTWEESFNRGSIPSGLESRRAVVVPAGEMIDEAKEAAKAYTRAMRDAGSPLTLDDSSLPDVSSLDDAAIVAAAAKAPVDVVIIVRTFPSEPTPLAVITIYALDGTPLGGVSAQRGQSVVGEVRELDQGVSVRAMESTRDAMQPGGKIPQDETPAAAPPQGRFSVVSMGRELTLIDRERDDRVNGKEIYVRLGHPDLVVRYDERARRKKVLTWTGAGVTATGLGLGVAGLLRARGAKKEAIENGDPALFEECGLFTNDRIIQNCRAEHVGKVDAVRSARILSYVGAGLALGGGITWIIGRSFRVHPWTRGEMQSETKRWNAQGKEEEKGEEVSMHLTLSPRRVAIHLSF